MRDRFSVQRKETLASFFLLLFSRRNVIIVSQEEGEENGEWGGGLASVSGLKSDKNTHISDLNCPQKRGGAETVV